MAEHKRQLTHAPQWRANTLILDIPEPGDPDWTGRWEIWLGRANTEHWTLIGSDPTRAGAIAFGKRIATVLYPSGHKMTGHDAKGEQDNRVIDDDAKETTES